MKPASLKAKYYLVLLQAVIELAPDVVESELRETGFEVLSRQDRFIGRPTVEQPGDRPDNLVAHLWPCKCSRGADTQRSSPSAKPPTRCFAAPTGSGRFTPFRVTQT